MNDIIASAERYVLETARVLERRRFEHLFRDGDPDAVVTALLPYRNADGGFGNALEPDCRAPGSQPVTTMAALHILDQVGAVGGPLGADICGYLESVAAPDGGVPFVHPSARGYPMAPWWRIPEEYEGSLLPTAELVGLLHKNGVRHPWVDAATEFCWSKVDALTSTHPYEALSCLRFLDHVPDRPRAEKAVARLGEMRRAGEFSTEGYAAGEVKRAYDYAPEPSSLAAAWFSPAELASDVDALLADRRPDGSWPVTWVIWHPVIAFEWGAWVTIEALVVLRAHGRV